MADEDCQGEEGLQFKQFFTIAKNDSTPDDLQAQRKKKPASKKKSAKALKNKGEEDAANEKKEEAEDPSEVTKVLKQWDSIRHVVRSLEKLKIGVIKVETLKTAIPELKDEIGEALPQIAKICPAVLDLVEDSLSGTVAVFPEVLVSTKEKRITLAAREKARKSVLRAALLRSYKEEGRWTTPKRERPVRIDDPILSKKEKDSNTLVNVLKQSDWYEDQIAHIERLEAVLPRFVSCDHKITHLLNCGRALYEHQARALEAALAKSHVVLATGTASGKSLAYKAATLESLHTDPDQGCLALYLFPTKALAQDQLGHLRADSEKLAEENPSFAFTSATLDGDTTYSERATICASPPTIILTNPDFLHFTALCEHNWRKALLSKLRFVVVDESHVYVGAFGTHVSMVLRRLRRLCEAHGASPVFFATSATVANPKEHTLALLPIRDHERLHVITEDASPRNAKAIVIWNPPFKLDNKDALIQPKPKKKRAAWRTPKKNMSTTTQTKIQDQLDARIAKETQLIGSEMNRAQLAQREREHFLAALSEQENSASNEFERRKSPIYETARIVAELTQKGIRSLCFCRTRKLVELVLMYARDLVSPDIAIKLAAYRGGYNKTERRTIEQGLFAGTLTCVIATNALELGVDVGELDATIHLGHPGSIASLWQQAGRAGRRPGSESIAVVVCWDSPLDQQFARAGSRLLKRGVESAALDILNENILRAHLRCAATERPLDPDTDAKLFCPYNSTKIESHTHTKDSVHREAHTFFMRCITELVGRGELVLNSDLYTAHPILDNERKKIQLRTIDPVQFEVRVNEIKLDEIPYSRAFYELFEGAIYMHQAKSYLIVKLDIRKYIAIAQPLKHCSYYTASQNHTDVDPINNLDIWPYGNICSTGLVRVHAHVWGYRKICRNTRKFLSSHEFSLPPLEFITRGTWIDLPEDAIRQVAQAGLDLAHGVHACTHAILNVAPLFVVCDQSDVDAEHVHANQQRPRPARIIIFDARPGGVGVAHAIFTRIYAVITEALRIITECPCLSSTGCPSCLFSSTCSAHNLALDSRAAVIILRSILKTLSPTNTTNLIQEKQAISPLRQPTLAAYTNASPNSLHIAPRTRRRAGALRRAAMLDDAATNGLMVRPLWAPCLPNFQPGLDPSEKEQQKKAT